MESPEFVMKAHNHIVGLEERIAELEDKNRTLGTDLASAWLDLNAASKHNRELEAELARLRPIADLYPLAWEECRKHRWAEMADTEQIAHDQARAKAGVV
jgi:hypothetical protein